MRRQIFDYTDLIEMFGKETNFAQVIERIESDLWQKGEVICEIHMNEKSLSQTEEEAAKAVRINDIKSLQVVSFKHSEVLRSSRDSIVDLIPKMKDSAQSVAEELRIKGEQCNFDYLVHLIDQCHWVSESLYLLRPQLVRIQPDRHFTERWLEAEKRLSSLAGHTLMSFQNRDYLQVSDLLEYELPSNLDLWNEILQSPQVVQSLQNM